ncbi:hypothetical protein EOM09_03775, partial [bacterium]|nr:hypothetical protein [bacterium]
MNRYDKLQMYKKMDLEDKIHFSKHRIELFLNKMGSNCVVSFSGGKDSTVLLHLCRQVKPDIKAIFVDTGLEYPEIRKFVSITENVETIKPKMRFDEVLRKYGYPVISKEVSRQISDIRNSKSQKLINKRLYGDEKGKCGKLSDKWKFLINSDIKISDKCCDVMKKRPFKKIMKNYNGVFIGTMTEDS